MADADFVFGVSALKSELQRAQSNLRNVNDELRKIIGRDPDDHRPVGRGRREDTSLNAGGRKRNFISARRGIISNDSPSTKRSRMGGAFSRLGPRVGGRETKDNYSGDEEELPNKPSISSSVVAVPAETRSRQDSIEESNKDERGKARNRRMFGVILGTLKRFKDESQETKDKDEQRRQIEKKLEEKVQQEKEELLQKKQDLFQERLQKQEEVHLIEQKMEVVQMHEKWEEETRKLGNFIRTRAKPHLFYLPKAMSPELNKKLRSTQKVVSEMIHERRKKLKNEIKDIMNEKDEDDHKDDKDTGVEDGKKSDKLTSRSHRHENKENKKDNMRSRVGKRDRKESGRSLDGETRVSRDNEGVEGEDEPVRNIDNENMEGAIEKEISPSETPEIKGEGDEED